MAIKFTVIENPNDVRDHIQDILMNVRTSDKSTAFEFTERAIKEIKEQEMVRPLNIREQKILSELEMELRAMKFFREYGLNITVEITL